MVKTADFQTFTKVGTIKTKFGPGGGVRLVQPNKNGSEAPDQEIFLLNTGNLYTPDKLNRFLYYMYWKLKL